MTANTARDRPLKHGHLSTLGIHQDALLVITNEMSDEKVSSGRRRAGPGRAPRSARPQLGGAVSPQLYQFLPLKARIFWYVNVDSAARGRPIIVEWERDARHSAGLSLVRSAWSGSLMRSALTAAVGHPQTLDGRRSAACAAWSVWSELLTRVAGLSSVADDVRGWVCFRPLLSLIATSSCQAPAPSTYRNAHAQ
ncbi:hypothetical protein EVAR_95603_1 [Eumeta japonica]|uniref:Uncharacterized protein n=1 Tax=Eumeta variegata TaxID=151549 RepID=A0A4C1VK63_EUMVA|nr:hypothetical protein EVAR_95603_1 [Eumeta japonica]